MIVYPNSTPVFARQESGGKGYNLYRTSKAGYPVPRWAVVGRSVYQQFIDESEIGGFLSETIQRLIKSELTPGQASKLIEERLVNSAVTPRLQENIQNAFNFVGADKVFAVRSSAIDEDSLGHSFAGQLSSYLYISGLEKVIESVRLCFASAFSERSLAYRQENKLLDCPIAVAVVLQEMLDPEVSGVMFTCNPLTQSAEEFVVSAVYGVGEGLVSGVLDADSYWLEAKSGNVLRQEVVSKPEQFRAGIQGIERKPVSNLAQTVPALSPADLQALYKLGLQLTQTYGRAQDLEWAICEGKLYLLQTRPVTTLSKTLSGYPNLWDNSNIIESYGGLTAPLSFSFALNNYRLVYQQFCEILGVSHRIVREMDAYLRNMLGCLDGRVYYNLYNWYKLIAVLPGFERNREFMETMMGVSQKLTQEINERISPHPSWYSWSGKLRKIRVGIRFLFYHFFIQTIVNRFQQNFRKSYSYFRSIDYSELTGDRIFQLYLEMESKMIGDWKAPIINDFLCMVHFGALKKLTNKWLSGVAANIQNDLLAGDGNLESAEPTRELLRLADLASQSPNLKDLILRTPANLLLETLNQSTYQDFYRQVQAYIERFGFRCMNEMKLEEVDLFSDPAYLFTCLKNYLKQSQAQLKNDGSREREIRQNAEVQIKDKLSGGRYWIYTWVLKHARKAVRNRENTRFARTRAYGIARSMFQAMGQDLAKLSVIRDPKDIFYLTLEEIYGIYQGTLSVPTLKDFVELRRKQYLSYGDSEPSARFLTRGAVYWNNAFTEPSLAKVEIIEGADLQGLPCSPGVVEGVVKVIDSARDDLNLQGEILVTPRTDPGWVPLYPSVSGLLVERGSLLSHSAIVAREMGLPAIVGISGLTAKLKSGMRVRMDGSTGSIVIIDPA